MNENSQLNLIAAELQAQGYKTQFNVDLREVSSEAAAPIKLDLVGYAEGDGRRDNVIVEIANRRRPHESDAGTERPPEEVFPERAKKIAAAFSEAPDPYRRFEIRFFDVSVDQATARRRTVKAAREELEQLSENYNTIMQIQLSGSRSVQHLLAMLVARTWARALREYAARLAKGRYVDMREDDLRTIHEELWDREGSKLTADAFPSPAAYRKIHPNILALFEGGDVDWQQLSRLEEPLKGLLRLLASGSEPRG